ncbi:MAG: hypothetical protein HY770_09050 [Chitinivibrionia bacterium]|nr:hypothetical protein [Chitinivibrionia bacterium]
MKTRCMPLMVLLLFVCSFPSSSFGRYVPTKEDKKALDGPNRVLVLDGSTVHNVGELQMHVGNWGIFGSWPGAGLNFSEAPSAQWPAGSGIEYLFVAGLWIGAVKSGVPAVSTAAYTPEFRPTQDPRDVMYRGTEGDRGGNRLPSPVADDDGDGTIDEDYLDGWDNDSDGLVDEDFGAISKQMFSCWYTDNQPVAIQVYPMHNPLNLMVRQESYQWEEDRYDDFVGIEYKITNIGTDILSNLYIGFFADCDAGPRDLENYYEDDATGRTFVQARCTDLGPVAIDIAYTYDEDGDEGNTEGYFGVMFLGHTTDPTGLMAPARVGISTYANFSGSQSYEEGGDPTNDFERYELLSKETIERDATAPRDYRMLVSAGPFTELMPESTLVFQVAFVIGNRLGGVLSNAASAQLTYDGAWFDMDIDSTTGVDGKETAFYNPTRNLLYAVEDSCTDPFAQTPVPPGQTVYVNGDCDRERFFKERCGYGDSRTQQAKYRTGVDGKETQINWLVGTAPPPPNMRIDCNSREGLVIYWDNYSESVPDVKTQKFDFEGYRVWRADDWDRPLGTSARNGPSHDLWKLLFEADYINSLGGYTVVDKYRYEPLSRSLAPAVKRDLIESMKAYFLEYSSPPPCPQGITEEMCDTLRALMFWEIGAPGGKQYYKYTDSSMHLGRPYFYSVTAMDHDFPSGGGLAFGKTGDPSSNFVFVEPCGAAQPAYNYDPAEVYVVPNPATTSSMAPWTLSPNNEDPTGIKVEFRNLPASKGKVRIFSLAGDLVQELLFDGTTGAGCLKWDLVSRNGQDVTSGIYLFSVESEDNNFDRKIGKFVVIR